MATSIILLGKEGGSYIKSGVAFKKFHVMASAIAGII